MFAHAFLSENLKKILLYFVMKILFDPFTASETRDKEITNLKH